MKNEEKIKILIGYLYSKNILSNINLEQIDIKKYNIIHNFLEKANNINIIDIYNNFSNINELLDNELKIYSFLKNTYKCYFKISYKKLYEYSIEGFFHEYKENEINTSFNDTNNIIIEKCKNLLKQYKSDDIKYYNLNNRINKLNTVFKDKESGLFFIGNDDIINYVSYGTQITIGLIDDKINNNIDQINYLHNDFEFNFNQIYIAKNFDLCNVNILAALIKNTMNINKFINKHYTDSLERLQNNMRLYNYSSESIKLLNELPNIIKKCNNKQALIDEINQNNPQNSFNILTVIHPEFSPYQMEKIAILEKQKEYSSKPIRNPKLSNEEIDSLSKLISQNKNVWKIRTSNFENKNLEINNENHLDELIKKQNQEINNNKEDIIKNTIEER